jgi:ABC-type sulfate transport system substrate-binding protein
VHGGIQPQAPPPGNRPPLHAAAGAGFPQPTGLFTIKDLGGWSEVNKRFFDKQAGVVAGIERTVGVSVGS